MLRLILAALLALAWCSGRPLAEDTHVVSLTSASFNQSVSSLDQVVAVKFYTEWCGWSQRLAPTWEALAAAYHNSTQVVIAQVECDREREICIAAEIKGLPTMKIYHAGASVAKYSGNRELALLEAWVEEQRNALLPPIEEF